MSSENHSGKKEDREAKGSVYACLAHEAADWIGIVGRFPPADESYGDGDQDADAGDVIENVQTSCFDSGRSTGALDTRSLKGRPRSG